MGFWHTGYMEFHQPAGIETILKPIKYPCDKCTAIFHKSDELSSHRFEDHPFHRPTLFVRGKEIGSKPYPIARELKNGDIAIGHCETITLNGQSCPTGEFLALMTSKTKGTYNIVLERQGVKAKFTLEFNIASEEDIKGVEDKFLEVVLGRRLSSSVISSFIESSKPYASAIRYCDGISAYLYGVLIKERKSETAHPFEKYIEKFNNASYALREYDQTLGRVIRALIAFHFNHFAEAFAVAENTSIGWASSQFLECLKGHDISKPSESNFDWLESSLADIPTCRIMALVKEFPDCAKTSTLDGITTEYDKAKIYVLLSESFQRQGKKGKAIELARELRNSPLFGKWADNFIDRLQGNSE